MLSSLFYTLALTATTALAAVETSPLFQLASTVEGPTRFDHLVSGAPAAEVQSTLWGYLRSCPTKHYMVIVEPGFITSSSSLHTSLIPETHNIQSGFTSRNINGVVNLVHVLNTILMDCLHYGVLTVEELDTDPESLSGGPPKLDCKTIDKSIIYARMPQVPDGLTLKEYSGLMQSRRQFVEAAIDKYFDPENYTFIYMTEHGVQVDDTVGEHGDGREVPFVGGHKA